MKSTIRNKVKYGTVDLPADAWDEGQFRMTLWIDLDVLKEIKHLAEQDGSKYQPWLNKKLREVILGEHEKNMKSVMKRLVKIERKMKIGA